MNPANAPVARRVESLSGSLATLRAEVRDPACGLFGPDSAVWEINRESLVFLGGGKAALLQLAHPFVAHAIDQHSTTLEDPIGRFHRTFLQVFDMVYGDLDQAFAAAGRVHGTHRHIHGVIDEPAGGFALGSHYTARDVDALIWVHTTLWETSVQVYELVHGELPREKKDRYVREVARFATLFGIRSVELPQSWEDFICYNQQMWESDRLTVGGPARSIADRLFQPIVPGTGPIMDAYRELSAALLPERLRLDFRLPPARVDRGRARLLLRAARLGRRVLPRGLCYLPPYHAALERLEGRRQPPFAETFRRVMLGPAR